MNKYLKIILIIISSIVLLVVVDLTCIFTINIPIIAIKKGNAYYGLYDCMEYSILQIKLKGAEYYCIK